MGSCRLLWTGTMTCLPVLRFLHFTFLLRRDLETVCAENALDLSGREPPGPGHDQTAIWCTLRGGRISSSSGSR